MLTRVLGVVLMFVAGVVALAQADSSSAVTAADELSLQEVAAHLRGFEELSTLANQTAVPVANGADCSSVRVHLHNSWYPANTDNVLNMHCAYGSKYFLVDLVGNQLLEVDFAAQTSTPIANFTNEQRPSAGYCVATATHVYVHRITQIFRVSRATGVFEVMVDEPDIDFTSPINRVQQHITDMKLLPNNNTHMFYLARGLLKAAPLTVTNGTGEFLQPCNESCRVQQYNWFFAPAGPTYSDDTVVLYGTFHRNFSLYTISTQASTDLNVTHTTQALYNDRQYVQSMTPIVGGQGILIGLAPNGLGLLVPETRQLYNVSGARSDRVAASPVVIPDAKVIYWVKLAGAGKYPTVGMLEADSPCFLASALASSFTAAPTSSADPNATTTIVATSTPGDHVSTQVPVTATSAPITSGASSLAGAAVSLGLAISVFFAAFAL